MASEVGIQSIEKVWCKHVHIICSKQLLIQDCFLLYISQIYLYHIVHYNFVCIYNNSQDNTIYTNEETSFYFPMFYIS